jgi:hypothetical protein
MQNQAPEHALLKMRKALKSKHRVNRKVRKRFPLKAMLAMIGLILLFIGILIALAAVIKLLLSL